MNLHRYINRNFILRAADAVLTPRELSQSGADYVVCGDAPYKLFGTAQLCLGLLAAEKGDAVAVDDPALLPLPHLTLRGDFAAQIREESVGAAETHFLPPQLKTTPKLALVLKDDGEIIGILEQIDLYKDMLLEKERLTWQMEKQIAFYKRIFDAMEDDVFITDGQGFIQYTNPRGESLCRIRLEDYVGRHVSDFEKDAVVSKSVTLEVLRTGDKVAEIVELSSGCHILATAQPIFDGAGNMIHVLSTSKDIAGINSQVDKISRELNSSKEEIKALQQHIIQQEGYILKAPDEAGAKPRRQDRPHRCFRSHRGESGTGKEVVADLVYRLSKRNAKPFVKINCGLIPKDLLESELFGYEAGAFTGAAKKGKIGKLETANGGTVFFDEIGEMDLALQVKLLEFMQDREIVRVGGTKRIPLDVRIVAATNRDLKAMVEEGSFRNDLYYRLKVMPIALMPLMNRREDIVPLTNQFIKSFNHRHQTKKRFSAEVVRFFLNYSWPGNVRELMNSVERLIVASDGDLITIDQFNEIFSENMTPGAR